MFKCGDIILNRWAGEDNPTRYFIFIKNNGKHCDVVALGASGKLGKRGYYTHDLENIQQTSDGKPAFEKVGHIDLKGFLKKPLLELLVTKEDAGAGV